MEGVLNLLLVLLARRMRWPIHSVRHQRVADQRLQQRSITEIRFGFLGSGLLLLLLLLMGHHVLVVAGAGGATAATTTVRSSAAVMRRWRSLAHRHPLPAWPAGARQKVQDLLFGRLKGYLLIGGAGGAARLFAGRGRGVGRAKSALLVHVVQIVVLAIDPAIWWAGYGMRR